MRIESKTGQKGAQVPLHDLSGSQGNFNVECVGAACRQRIPLLAQRSRDGPRDQCWYEACRRASHGVTSSLALWAWLNKPPERCAILAVMADFSILTDEFALVAAACHSHRRYARACPGLGDNSIG